MAIQANTTVKGAVINNAYIKIQRVNVSGQPKPAVVAKAAIPATATKPAVPAVVAQPAGTNWVGNVVVGVFANKALADASSSNAIDTSVINIPNVLVLPTGNVVAALYSYLLTLPQYTNATSV